MKRRAFLQSILGGVAVLTIAQREAIERQIEAIPADPKTAGHAAADIPPPGLRWREPVEDRFHFPSDPEECDAVVVLDDDRAFIYVADIGWLQMAVASGVST